MERKYLIHKGEEIPEADLLYDKPTTEKNGVIVSVTLNRNWDEYRNCIKAIKQQLSYLDNIVYQIENFDNSFQIFRNDLFAFNNLQSFSELHLCLKGIYYPINWQKLGISRLNIPIALVFNDYNDLQPVFNREDLIWNSKSVEAVKGKLAEVAKWFVDKYNDNLGKKNSLLEAWDEINVYDKKVHLNGKDLVINQLAAYTSTKIQELEVKGVKHLSPSWFKSNKDLLMEPYRVVGMMSNGIVKTKFRVYSTPNLENYTANQNCLLDDAINITGYFRDYLRTLDYKNFIKSSIIFKSKDMVYWEQKLKLDRFPKNLWKEVIKEFEDNQKQFLSELVTDCRDLHLSQDFEDFKKSQRQKPKTKRLAGLNKQKHEVTISYQEPKKYSGYCFKKSTFTLENLYKNPFLTVIMEEDEGEKMEKYATAFSKQKLKFCKIGIQDRKKIENLKLHNFMTFKDLERTKSFSRTVTGLLADEVISNYDKVMGRNIDVVNHCLLKFGKLYKEVKVYSDSNSGSVSGTSDIAVELYAIANKFDLWDREMIGKVRKLEGYVADFDFINCLNAPSYYQKQEEERVEKLIYQMLLFKKHKYPETLEHLTITKK